ncbi:MAG: hypothetical protein WC146_00800 [Patescibacteria group bacterium]
MKKILFKKIILAVSFTTLLLCSSPALAGYSFFKDSGLDKSANQAGYETADATNVEGIISTVISALLGLLGVIFFVLIIYGGFIWMTAQGNETKVKSATETVLNAFIGLVIVLAAYAISYFIMSKL